MEWQNLTEEKYNEIVNGTLLSNLTLSEVVEIAADLDRFYDIAGVYYQENDTASPTIIIDREQSVGGYNNSELTLNATDNYVISNDKNFQTSIRKNIAYLLSARQDNAASK